MFNKIIHNIFKTNNINKNIEIEIEKIYVENNKIAQFIKDNLDEHYKIVEINNLSIDNIINILSTSLDSSLQKIYKVKDITLQSIDNHELLIKTNDNNLEEIEKKQNNLTNLEKVLFKNKPILKEVIDNYKKDLIDSIAKINVCLPESRTTKLFNFIQKTNGKKEFDLTNIMLDDLSSELFKSYKEYMGESLIFKSLKDASLFLEDVSVKIMDIYQNLLNKLQLIINKDLNLPLQLIIQEFIFVKVIKSKPYYEEYEFNDFENSVCDQIINPFSLHSIVSKVNQNTFNIGKKEEIREITEYHVNIKDFIAQIENFIFKIQKNVIEGRNKLEIQMDRDVILINNEKKELSIKKDHLNSSNTKSRQNIVHLNETMNGCQFYDKFIERLLKRLEILKTIICKGR